MADVENVRIAAGDSELICNPVNGADITHLTLGGKVLIKPRAFDTVENPWLFPFPNRLRDGEYEFEGKAYQFEHNDYGRPNALHGFVLGETFEVKAQQSSDEAANMSLFYDYKGERDDYPFPFTIQIDYKLTGEALTIDIKIQNNGTGNLPAGLGWHPYFDLPSGKDNATLKMPACHEIEVDDLMIPTGKKSPSTCFDAPRNLKGVGLDTCFEINDKSVTNEVVLKAGEDYEISVWQDAAHGFIQVYTPDDGASIAIEPMTCGIDAFNTKEGLKIMTPGEIWEVSCGVKLV